MVKSTCRGHNYKALRSIGEPIKTHAGNYNPKMFEKERAALASAVQKANQRIPATNYRLCLKEVVRDAPQSLTVIINTIRETLEGGGYQTMADRFMEVAANAPVSIYPLIVAAGDFMQFDIETEEDRRAKEKSEEEIVKRIVTASKNLGW